MNLRLSLPAIWLALALLVPAPATAADEEMPQLPFAEAVRSGDALYLSGQIGIAPGADRPVSGGLAAETGQAMDNIGAILRRNGLGFGDIVRCVAMLADMSQWPEFNRVYATYFPNGRFPARSSFGVTGLALGATVEIECTARFPVLPVAINPGVALGPYSQAVAAGGLIHVSGIVAFDAASGTFAPADIESQMRQVLANLDEVLAGAGAGREDVVRTTVFLRDPRDFPAVNTAYANYFEGLTLPARTTVPGADWGRPDIMVEVDAVAVARPRVSRTDE